jgi:hypothetical protein
MGYVFHALQGMPLTSVALAREVLLALLYKSSLSSDEYFLSGACVSERKFVALSGALDIKNQHF